MDRFSSENGVFHITPKPGLPQVGIMHGFWVPHWMRGKGNGHALMNQVNLAAAYENYDYLICTTSADNKAMQSCLSKAGWQHIHTFENSKTGEPHQLWGFDLNVI